MYIPGLDLLSRDEERRLALRYRAGHEHRIAERLIRAHLRVVMVIVRRYRFAGHDPRDLFQVGAIGLVQALDRFDPARGVRLSTYASSWIHAMILRYLWENRRLVRPSYRRRAQLARYLRTPEREIDVAMRASDDERPDVLVEDAEHRARALAAIDRFAHGLGARDRAIFDSRFRQEDPPTLEDLGARFGVTRERVRQLEASLLSRLRDHVVAELRP